MKLDAWLTDPKLAREVVKWADIGSLWAKLGRAPWILEPSAGEGAFLVPLLEELHALGWQLDPDGNDRTKAHVVAVEIHAGRAAYLRKQFPGVRVIQRDFVAFADETLAARTTHEAAFDLAGREPFDLAIQNPPYADGADVEHVQRAARMATDLVCLVRSVFGFGVDGGNLFEEVKERRRWNLRRRPHFVDKRSAAERTKDGVVLPPADGSPRHDFSVLHLHRPGEGWSRAADPIDCVAVERR